MTRALTLPCDVDCTDTLHVSGLLRPALLTRVKIESIRSPATTSVYLSIDSLRRLGEAIDERLSELDSRQVGGVE